MEDMIVKANGLSVVVTQEDVDDIMSTALDSHFVQRWCSEVNVVGRYLGEYASEQISRGGEVEFYDNENETYYTLTLENFAKGLKMYLEENDSAINDYGTEAMINVVFIDEEVADTIIQYALFDDIIYC